MDSFYNTFTNTRRYVDKYFLKTKELLEIEEKDPEVVYQIFQRNEGAIVCGIPYVLNMFKTRDVTIFYKPEGSKVSAWEPIMHICGKVSQIVDLETLYLGTLARCTRVATNVRGIRNQTDKRIIFMGARFDVPEAQRYDGYAAFIGGADDCSTDVQAEWGDSKGVGTMPHALIACYEGDVANASLAYAKHLGKPIIALVDFNNDCVGDSIKTARLLKEHGFKLDGVRLDTPRLLVDTSLQEGGWKGHTHKSFSPEEQGFVEKAHDIDIDDHMWEIVKEEFKGVNPYLVNEVRKALDIAGFRDVQIYVSGGFNAERVKEFEDANALVDGYGIGSSMFSGNFDYTADIVTVNGKDMAKAGREFKDLAGETSMQVFGKVQL